MFLKRFISIFLLLNSINLVNAQTHMLFGSASGMTTGTGDYYSWSIGEVIVFNENAANPFLAQSMQSYTNPIKVDNCFKIPLRSNSEQLCTGVSAFNKVLTFSLPSSIVKDEVQWYFSESGSAPDSLYAKIVGANSLQDSTYKPYFPGFYKVCIKSTLLNCAVCSDRIEVNLSASSLAIPYISQDGQPAKNITVNYTASGSPTVQWYAFVPTLNKYLIVAGGNNPTLKVRYDGDYMAIVSYPNSCKLSSNTTVSGYNRLLYRATDVIMDGNTIYIPDETAYPYSSLKIFPNPAINSFTVQFESSIDFISRADLYSGTGLLVKRIDFNEGDYWSKTAIVNAEDLSAGVYFLKVNEGSRQIVQKLVLQK